MAEPKPISADDPGQPPPLGEERPSGSSFDPEAPPDEDKAALCEKGWGGYIAPVWSRQYFSVYGYSFRPVTPTFERKAPPDDLRIGVNPDFPLPDPRLCFSPEFAVQYSGEQLYLSPRGDHIRDNAFWSVDLIAGLRVSVGEHVSVYGGPGISLSFRRDGETNLVVDPNTEEVVGSVAQTEAKERGTYPEPSPGSVVMKMGVSVGPLRVEGQIKSELGGVRTEDNTVQGQVGLDVVRLGTWGWETLQKLRARHAEEPEPKPKPEVKPEPKPRRSWIKVIREKSSEEAPAPEMPSQPPVPKATAPEALEKKSRLIKTISTLNAQIGSVEFSELQDSLAKGEEIEDMIGAIRGKGLMGRTAQAYLDWNRVVVALQVHIQEADESTKKVYEDALVELAEFNDWNRAEIKRVTGQEATVADLFLEGGRMAVLSEQQKKLMEGLDTLSLEVLEARKGEMVAIRKECKQYALLLEQLVIKAKKTEKMADKEAKKQKK